MQAPFSSLAYSIAAYQPYISPPITPQTNYVAGGYAGMGTLVPMTSKATNGAPIVSRVPRERMRYLYSYGTSTKKWFRMIATGQVESTKFQPRTGHLYDASFNKGLYEAGYPQNLGISVKVPTVPNALVNGSSGPEMTPAYAKRKTIFTRRAYSTVPAVPAKGAIA